MFLKAKRISSYQVVDSEVRLLGEGCQVSLCGKYAAFVDIKAKSFVVIGPQQEKVAELTLVTTPSAIFSLTASTAVLLDDIGVVSINYLSRKVERLRVIPELQCYPGLRGNDGAIIRGSIYFGTMEFVPRPKSGAVYVLDGDRFRKVDDLGIPNTFIELKSGLLVSDSLEKKIFHYSWGSYRRALWCDLSDTGLTPDGGCITKCGRVFIAMWGGSCIAEFDQNGSLISKHEVPAINPTNCCDWGGQLFITSASEGVDAQRQSSDSLDGQTFLLKF